MKLLLHTHVVLWSVDQPHRLSATAQTEITDPVNDLAVSAATIWEIAIKWGDGKLTLSQPYLDWMIEAIITLNLEILPVTVAYANQQAALPRHHGDPFDRLMIAQSLVDGITIVSADAIFDAYGVSRLW